MVQRKTTDLNGKIIQILLCLFIWYSEVVQQRYVQIPGALVLLGGAMIAMVLLDLTAARNRQALQRIPAAAWIIFSYILLTFVIGFFVTPNESMHIDHGVLAIQLSLIMMVICYYSVTRKDLTFLLWNLFVMCLFTCVVFLSSPVVYFEAEQVRYSFSSQMNPNVFAMQLATGIWATLYLLTKKKVHPLIALLLCAVYIYGIILTGSRKGLVGAAICLVGWLYFCYIPSGRGRDAANQLLRLLLMAAVIVLAIAIIVPVFMSSDIMERFADFFKEGGGSRTDMYEKGWQYLQKSPWFGLGYWGFGYYYGAYSHATLVEVPVTSGILLGAFYFYSYINIFGNIFKQWRNTKRLSRDKRIIFKKTADTRMALVLMLMLMFYTVCVIHIYQTMSFICFAMIISAYAMGSKKEDEVSEG